MRKLLSNGLAVFAGVVSLPVAGTPADSAKPATAEHRNEPAKDPRLAFLRAFFEHGNCPAAKLSPVFLAAADMYALDWRLLPSLALVETGGGRVAKGNNIFGWANGKSTFTSIGEAMHHVARALSLGQAYRGKSLDGKLAAFNQGTDYGAMVRDIMNQISPRTRVEVSD